MEKLLFGLPGFVSCTFSPGFKSIITPGPSSRLLSSSASICCSSGIIEPTAPSLLASSFSMNTENIPDTTAATSSASVYFPSCFRLSMTGARNGTPLRCPILSRVIMCSTFLLPVLLPYASTLCHLMSVTS